ncbi:MAG: hypothetical protein AB8F95_17025 [Bacteroidia bacterium]
MKIFALLLAASLLLSCENNTATPVEFAGAWLNKAYLDTLMATQSPRAAQKIGDICKVIYLPDSIGQEAVLAYGQNNSLKQVLDKKGGKYFLRETPQLFLSFENENMIIAGEYFVRTDAMNGQQLTHITEAILFAGTYKNGAREVTFLPNGSIQGLDDFDTYSVMDNRSYSGNSSSPIWLGKGDFKEEFGFGFNADTLHLHKIEYIAFEDGGNWIGNGIFVESDTPFYSLIKQ